MLGRDLSSLKEKGRVPTHQRATLNYVGLFGHHPTRECYSITIRGAQANELQSECPASTSVRETIQIHSSVTHSTVVLRLRNPQVRSQSQQPSSQVTSGVKAKALSAVKNESKAVSLEAHRALAPKGN